MNEVSTWKLGADAKEDAEHLAATGVSWRDLPGPDQPTERQRAISRAAGAASIMTARFGHRVRVTVQHDPDGDLAVLYFV